jgi:hypothetical protein
MFLLFVGEACGIRSFETSIQGFLALENQAADRIL